MNQRPCNPVPFSLLEDKGSSFYIILLCFPRGASLPSSSRLAKLCAGNHFHPSQNSSVLSLGGLFKGQIPHWIPFFRVASRHRGKVRTLFYENWLIREQRMWIMVVERILCEHAVHWQVVTRVTAAHPI